MTGVLRKLSCMKPDRKGSTAIEYGLIMALMALALIGALSTTGAATEDKWDGVANKVEEATQNIG